MKGVRDGVSKGGREGDVLSKESVLVCLFLNAATFLAQPVHSYLARRAWLC